MMRGLHGEWTAWSGDYMIRGLHSKGTICEEKT